MTTPAEPQPQSPEEIKLAHGNAAATKRFLWNLIRCVRLANHMHDVGIATEDRTLYHELFRALVVLLHATFEDYLRSVARAKNVPGDPLKRTFSKIEHLETLLRALGVDPAPFKQYEDNLKWLVKRRHLIVHEADIASESPIGWYAISQEDARNVTIIFETLKDFCNSLAQRITRWTRQDDMQYITEQMKRFEEERDKGAWGDEPQQV